jgi:hypothetical protein
MAAIPEHNQPKLWHDWLRRYYNDIGLDSTLDTPSQQQVHIHDETLSGQSPAFSQAALSPPTEPDKEHNKSPPQYPSFNETLANSAEYNDSAAPTSRTNEDEDALAEGEYFIRVIKSDRCLDLVKWHRRPEQEAEWMPWGSILRKGKLYAERILDSKLELEIQYEGHPEAETTEEAERMLRCPNLVGPNLLQQYKEKHRLGVYEDGD